MLANDAENKKRYTAHTTRLINNNNHIIYFNNFIDIKRSAFYATAATISAAYINDIFSDRKRKKNHT